MVPRETGNNACAKFGGTNKESYDFRKWPIAFILYVDLFSCRLQGIEVIKRRQLDHYLY